MATLRLGNVPYVFGGNNETTGLDCSSYIQAIYKEVGIDLPRSTKEQVNDQRFMSVKLKDRTSGDLIFFKNTYRRGVSHVGVFIDENYFVHASSKDGQIVVERFDQSRYFKKRFYSLKRLRAPLRAPAEI